MKLFSNQMYVGSNKTLEEIAKEMFGEKQASSNEKNVKTASSLEELSSEQSDQSKEVVAEVEDIEVEESEEVVASSDSGPKTAINEKFAESHDDSDDDNDGDDDNEDEESGDSEGEEDSTKEACASKLSNSSKYIKIANLNPKQKEFVKSYFKMIYPENYADAMVQDK